MIILLGNVDDDDDDDGDGRHQVNIIKYTK